MKKTKIEIFAENLIQELREKGQRAAENLYLKIIEENKLPLWAQTAIQQEFHKLKIKMIINTDLQEVKQWTDRQYYEYYLENIGDDCATEALSFTEYKREFLETDKLFINKI